MKFSFFDEHEASVLTVPLYVWVLILAAGGFFNYGIWPIGVALLVIAAIAFLRFHAPP